MKLFISYRRSESEAIAKRIHAALEGAFGTKSTFIDERDVGLGEWLRYVMNAVNAADVCVVVIGPTWLTVTNSETGERRLFELGDVVRREIEAGLLRPLLVIVLVDGASVPRKSQLPDTIQTLPANQALMVRADDAHFDADMQRVTDAITAHNQASSPLVTAPAPSTPAPQPNPGPRLPIVGAIAALVTAVVIVALILNGRQDAGGALTVTPDASSAAIVVTSATEPTAIGALSTEPPTATIPTPSPPPPTDSPTPPATDTPTPDATQREGTLQAEMNNLQTEQAVTQDANARATASVLTATAAAWTDTPTPDDRATAAARLTATQVQRDRTATADAWTDTPTPTYTPSRTPSRTSTLTPSRTPTLTPIPPGAAGNPVTSNAQWTPRQQDFGGVTMVEVPAGCFTIGAGAQYDDEQNGSEVCFEAPFWIDRTEVTQAQFTALGGVKAIANRFDGDQRPVEQITWFEARDFCALRGARLPSEAEWEYAARGVDELEYPWGETFVADNLVYGANSNDQTAEVGSRPAGASWVGALDMSGNVWEWTRSEYAGYPYMRDDGREDDPGNRTDVPRVLRGGSWGSSNTDYFRAANRGWLAPDDQDYVIGFRCVLSP